MSAKVSPAIAAVIIALVCIVIGYFGYRALVPQKVLLAPGTKLTPPAPPVRGR